jgi:hypothetical protein
MFLNCTDSGVIYSRPAAKSSAQGREEKMLDIARSWIEWIAGKEEEPRAVVDCSG